MNLGAKTKTDSAIPAPPSGDKDRVVYPTLYISDVKGLDKLPDGDFSFTGKGRVSTMKHDKKNGTCTCEIEIIDFTPTGKEKKSADSLDETLKEKEMEVMAEDDEEEESDE
jgi:hypothetical protein